MNRTGILGAVARAMVSAAAVLGALVAVAAVVALATGIRPVIFLTGSMAPAIGAGSLALTAPVDADGIRSGDIISATRADGVRVTHRAVAVTEGEGDRLLSMRGDANNAEDSDHYIVTDGADRVFWHVEELGALVGSVHSPGLVAGAVALLVIALLPRKKTPAAERLGSVQPGSPD